MQIARHLGFAAITGFTLATIGTITIIPADAATWECSAKGLKNYRYRACC